MDFTTPMSTSLYLMRVLWASRPSALRKRMVMRGPVSITCWKRSHAPTSAATIGMIQMGCSQRTPALRGTACGISDSLTVAVQRIPDEPRVEAHRREHGEEHHRG